MKKFLATLIVVVMLVSLATVTAGASSFDFSAEELGKLGLLQGTDSGYDLDTAPTRVQAVIMLIRLLGRDETAKAEGGEHPFDDIPEWADAYVGYAFENNLAKGVTETQFKPDDKCNAQMYVTFMLRALGYNDDDGDFTYNEALDFGAKVGIVDETLTQGDFLRDQMVFISYLALLTAPKDSEFDTLLAALVDAGAVTQEAADGFTARLALLDEVMSIGSELTNVTGMEIGATVGGTMSVLGESVSFAITADAKIIGADDDMSVAVTMEMDGEEFEIYIKDGVMYMNAEGEKMQVELGLEDIIATATQTPAQTDGASIANLYLYENVTKTTEGDYTVYTVTVNNAYMDSILALAAAEAGDADVSMSMSPIKYYLDADGALKKITTTIDMAMTMVVEGSTIDMDISLDVEIEILATGDAVTITFPDDLDTYEAVELAA